MTPVQKVRQLQEEMGDKFYEFASLCYAEAKYQSMKEGIDYGGPAPGDYGSVAEWEEAQRPESLAGSVPDNEHDDSNSYLSDLRDAYVKLGYLPPEPPVHDMDGGHYYPKPSQEDLDAYTNDPRR